MSSTKKHGLSVLAIAILAILTIGAKLDKAVPIKYKKDTFSSRFNDTLRKVNKSGQGFIVEAYIQNYDGYHCILLENRDVQAGAVDLRIHSSEDTNYLYSTPSQFEIYDTETSKRINEYKKHIIYIGIYQNKEDTNWYAFVDKIEGLRTLEEVAAIEAAEAQRKAEEEEKRMAEEAKRKAEQEAKEAEAAAQEAGFNPNKLDRSKYKEITVEDFSFDMTAGKLPAGTKVAFEAEFLGKPTGTTYSFRNISSLITMSTTHNFVRDMPRGCFGQYQLFGSWMPQESVKLFVTVKKPGKTGECSVDIIEWEKSFSTYFK